MHPTAAIIRRKIKLWKTVYQVTAIFYAIVIKPALKRVLRTRPSAKKNATDVRGVII